MTEILIVIFLITLFYIYDKHIQRRHQLLINYPIIGRFRYFFEILREPLRQYFADEKFYESRDKVNWVYKASKNLPNYLSFSVGESDEKAKFYFKHATPPLNDNEVEESFSITFGENRPFAYHAKSPIGRSAMSDGSISPEGTRAFVQGAFMGHFPVNSGEGGLTSNFFTTHKTYNETYMDVIKGGRFSFLIYKMIEKIFNGNLAISLYRAMILPSKVSDTYLFHKEKNEFYRPNWNAPLDHFPSQVPDDMADVIFQMGSGLYGVRNDKGEFCKERYKKIMSFCRMTEIKLAQGAKQTGGKLLGDKVSEAVAYFRGIEPHKSIISPNRFPYAQSPQMLCDFVQELQTLSQKPVGIKIVISGLENVTELISYLAQRDKASMGGIPDFITVDSGEGGSGAAPLELMDRIGLGSHDSIFILDTLLKKFGLRDKIKIISSGKILTPDDVVLSLALGADFVNIARGFMMSAGCIRARHCSGADGIDCPVGLATQNPAKRYSFLTYEAAQKIESYHTNLIKGVKMVLAVLGCHTLNDLSRSKLLYIDQNQKVYNNVDDFFYERFEKEKTLLEL